MQLYVCGFLVSRNDVVVLLRKRKPDWQSGLLNGVGGKVEQGESPLDAMHREWREETYDAAKWPWRHFCTQTDGLTYGVDFFVARTDELPRLPRTNDVGELIVLRNLVEVINPRSDAVCNLRWLLPLACWEGTELSVTAIQAEPVR